jgi:ATP-dependent Clp protease protease subunit
MLVPRTQEMQGDPFGLLLQQRIIFMGGEVNDFMADAIISQLLLLDAQDPTKDIKLFVNSPGGSVTAGMGIYDAMQMCRADIQTCCFGLAASMGAFILGAGAKGKRSSMPNARIMIHQPLGGASGQAVDLEIQAKEIMYHKANLNRIMSEYTGQPIDKIEEDTDRDRYMSPLESKQYGIIDTIIGGDEAGFVIQGDTRNRPMTKEDYVSYGNDSEDATRGSRFRGVPVEPYTKPLADE